MQVEAQAALHDEVCVEVGGELDVVLMEIADAADGRGTVSRMIGPRASMSFEVGAGHFPAAASPAAASQDLVRAAVPTLVRQRLTFDVSLQAELGAAHRFHTLALDNLAHSLLGRPDRKQRCSLSLFLSAFLSPWDRFLSSSHIVCTMDHSWSPPSRAL